MKFALDATPLTEGTGGISRYTAELTRALAEQSPEDEYWLLSDQPFPRVTDGLPNIHYGQPPTSILNRRWWLIGLAAQLRRLNIDLFHGAAFSVPYFSPCPSVLTLHDLSPWLQREWHTEASRIRRRTPLLLKFGRATMVITPSQAIRAQAIERFGLSPERVVAIPEAASPLFRPIRVDAPVTPYILFVGTLEPRKNIAVLVEAWREVRKQHKVDLVLVGRCRPDFQAPHEEDGLQMLGAVPDQRLPELYSGALAVAYPSFYEGFGLPVLEAMQCGAAVITSLDSAITETFGGAAMQVDAWDRRGWAEALRCVIQRQEWVAHLRARSLACAQNFTWARTARLTREVYVEALHRAG